MMHGYTPEQLMFAVYELSITNLEPLVVGRTTPAHHEIELRQALRKGRTRPRNPGGDR